MITELITEVSAGINLVDIGCSGTLNSKWSSIESYINLSGFDPNEDECRRLAALPNKFRSVTYHPYAVAGHNGSATLYKTKSIYCYSLLKPDTEWLRRFSFHELLEVIGEEPLNVVTLNSIPQFQDLDLDGLKIDAQGLEREILNGAGDLLNDAIYVETESGFTPNYINESTQAEIDEYMRSKGFLLFDLILYRMPQDNIFKDINPERAQLLWSESVWLRDYILMHKSKQLIPGNNINRHKAIKALVICAVQGCIDYGYELARIFFDLNLLTNSEFEKLSNKDSWRLTEEPVSKKAHNTAFTLFLRLFPASARKWIQQQAELAAAQKHIFR